jgi:DnaJ-class molecular chaperone
MYLNNSSATPASKYEKITLARNILELPESATMDEIKSNYRRLIQKWHPDRCDKNKEMCHKMTAKIIQAQQINLKYCYHYKYSFKKGR